MSDNLNETNLDEPDRPENIYETNLDEPDRPENIYETNLDEPAYALGRENPPPPQYEEPTVQFGEDAIPSYEEVMANSTFYHKTK